MIKQSKQSIKKVSYETVAEAFSEEANSLIADSVKEQVLKIEKVRFENASLLSVSADKFMGHNTARYCKDLLREQQPLPFLYRFLCFLTEVSLWMIPYGIYCTVRKDTTLSCLCWLVVVIGLELGSTVSKRHLRSLLSSLSLSASDTAGIDVAKKKLRRFRLLLFCGAVVFIVAAEWVIVFWKIGDTLTVGLAACFAAYIVCILLSGIHNVIYSGHCLAFFTVGSCLLTRQPKEKAVEAARHYCRLRYAQMLSPSHKTLDDLDRNPALENTLRESLHSHMTTQRVYDVLAIVILLALDIVCLIKLSSAVTVALICFFAVSVVCTLIFVFAFACANYLFKQTR